MFERILIPLDGSSTAEIVFPYVVDLTQRFGSELYLVHVAETTSAAENQEAITYLQGARFKIGAMLEDWGAKKDTKIETKELIGNAAVEILKFATEINASLIAVASHGASSTVIWALGNIAAKILRAATFPVLLIRKPAAEASLADKKLIKKILAPLDGSELGEAAIPYVVELARNREAGIILFRVVEPVTSFVGPTGEIAWNFINTYEKNAMATVLSYLERLKNTLTGVDTLLEIATSEGQPASEIMDYAQANNIDLIAMSTHGRSGIGRWVYGSVTEKVLHSGEVPILVVQPKTAK